MLSLPASVHKIEHHIFNNCVQVKRMGDTKYVMI